MTTTNAVTPMPMPTFAPVLSPDPPEDDESEDGLDSVKPDGTEDAGAIKLVIEAAAVVAVVLSENCVAVATTELRLAGARVAPRFRMIKAGLGNWFGYKG